MSLSSGAIPVEIVFQMLRRGWKRPLLGALFTPLVAMAAWSLVPDSYQSGARVIVQDQATVNPFLEDLTVSWKVKHRVPLVRTVLKSRATLELVLRELGELDEHAAPDEIEDATSDLARRLSATDMGGGVVAIKLKGRDPDKVHKGALALLQAFVREMLRPQRENIAASAEFLNSQISRLRSESLELEDDLMEFKTENATEVPELHRLNVQEHIQIRRSLMAAEVKLEARRRQLEVHEARLRAFNPVARRLETLLIEAETELERVRVQHTSLDPKVHHAEARVEDLRARLRAARSTVNKFDPKELEAYAGTLVAPSTAPNQSGAPGAASTGDLLTSELLRYKSVANDLSAAQAEVTALQTALNESEQSLRAFASNEQVLGRINRRLESKMAIYETLLGKYEDALVKRELARYDRMSQVWILEAPVKPVKSSKPPRIVAGIAGGVIGFILGLVWLCLGEFLSTRVRTPEEVAELVGAPLLGSLPPSQRS